MEILVRKNSNAKYNADNSGFLANISGDTSMQFALVVGAVSVAAALLVPLTFSGSSRLVFTDHKQIDRTVTGSVGPVKRYRIRKSVLDNTK